MSSLHHAQLSVGGIDNISCQNQLGENVMRENKARLSMVGCVPPSPIFSRRNHANNRVTVMSTLPGYKQKDGSVVYPVEKRIENKKTLQLPSNQNTNRHYQLTPIHQTNECASSQLQFYVGPRSSLEQCAHVTYTPNYKYRYANDGRQAHMYQRMNSCPNTTYITAHITEQANRNREASVTIPLHSVVITKSAARDKSSHLPRSQSADTFTPAVHFTAEHSDELKKHQITRLLRHSDSDRSTSSDRSSSTITGDYYIQNMDIEPSDNLLACDTHNDATKMNSSAEKDSPKPELYPEHRQDVQTRLKSHSMLNMSCFEMMHNAHIYLELLSHKLDIVEQSLQLLSLNIDAMTDLAVTTPPCTKIDTEFCICHQKFDAANHGHGIWKYFCDGEKCSFCCQVFERLAERPTRLYHLSVLDLNLDLLKSGAVSVTGQPKGLLIVYIETQNKIWNDCDEDCLLDLANILEYIVSSVRDGKISVFVDCRQSSDTIVQLIMDALNNTQATTQGGIKDATFIVDRPSLISEEQTHAAAAAVKLEFCSQAECLTKIEPSKLPKPLGGQYQFAPDSWIRSQAGLERLLQHYQRALDGILHTTHSLSLVPRTIRHASKVTPQHEKAVRALDKATKLIKSEGYYHKRNTLDDPDIKQLLQDLDAFMKGTSVLSQLMDSLQSLGQMTRQVSRLKSLAEERLAKLHGCQRIWHCIEEITKTLTLLRKAQDLINKHRILSNNLKSAQSQYNNFIKVKPSITKLLVQGNELLTECVNLQTQANPKIPWLEDLSLRLEQELSYLGSLLGKTELLITDTYYCYSTLDQAYDWAVESMKFISSMNMDQCLTEEGVEILRKSLVTFMREHRMIDSSIFDEVTRKAQNLDNRKLIEQCRIARARCEETKRVMKVRETTIRKAREEIEAQRARKVSLEELSANTNIKPLTQHSNTSTTCSDEDIWIPQKITDIKDDSNNNVSPRYGARSNRYQTGTKATLQTALSFDSKLGHTNECKSLEKSESCDTITSSQYSDSQDDLPSQLLVDNSEKVTPLLSDYQKETSLVKRRSFAGFTTPGSYSYSSLAKKTVEVIDEFMNTETPDQHEGFDAINDRLSGRRSSSLIEQIEGIGLCQSIVKAKHQDSLLGSAPSILSSHDERTEATEDSGVLSKSASSSHSNDSCNQEGNQWSPVPVNSHLMNKRVITASQWQSMSDLRLTEAEIQSRRTLAHIMDELVQTERDYVMSLRLIVEKYIPEIERSGVPQPLRGKRSVVFGNIEKIYEFHNHCFLKELEECENQPFKISQCFLDHEKEFMMYALYNKNKPNSDTLMTDHGTNYFQELQNKLGDKMNLSSYLLKPVQRMTKYNLIIKQILKECPESAAEYHDLTTAQEMIRFCLQHGNDLLAMDSLKECDVNLQEQGMLLLQDEFTVQKGRHKAMKRHLFLFEDLLVFAKPKKIIAGQDEYIYKSSLKTVDLGLTENVGTSGLKFEIWFRKRSQDTWVLQATTSQIKNNWVRKLEKILWNQAIKNRECRLTELSSMGIGSKPSLDLKLSEDNITNRQINTDVNHKVMRMKSMPGFGESDVSSISTSQTPESIASKDDSYSTTYSQTSSSQQDCESQQVLQPLSAAQNPEKPNDTETSTSSITHLDNDWLHQVRRSDSGVSSMSTNSFVSTVSLPRPEDKTVMVLSLCEQPLNSHESKV